MAKRGYVLTVHEAFCCPCVVMHAQIVQCVYAKILRLACAHVVPKALRSFFSKFTPFIWDA